MIWLAIAALYTTAGFVLAACMRNRDRRHKLEASRHASSYISVLLLWPIMAVVLLLDGLCAAVYRFERPLSRDHNRIRDEDE